MSCEGFSNGVVAGAQRAHIDNLRRQLEQLVICKTPDEQEVSLVKDEATKVATICIRSGAKNALSGKMISKLTDILDELHEWNEGKAVLIHGYGNTFCSGSDLVCARATANHESGLQLAEIMQYNLMRLQSLPMVSVAFVEGYALGGGAELATGADLRLMSKSAKIGFVHVKVGVCCGWGGGARLVQLVGPSRALDLLASGRSVGPEEALQIGLCNALATDLTEAMDYTLKRTVGPLHTVRALKSVINSARLYPLAQSLQIEGHLFASSWGKDEHLYALDCNIKHNKQ